MSGLLSRFQSKNTPVFLVFTSFQRSVSLGSMVHENYKKSSISKKALKENKKPPAVELAADRRSKGSYCRENPLLVHKVSVDFGDKVIELALGDDNLAHGDFSKP